MNDLCKICNSSLNNGRNVELDCFHVFHEDCYKKVCPEEHVRKIALKREENEKKKYGDEGLRSIFLDLSDSDDVATNEYDDSFCPSCHGIDIINGSKGPDEYNEMLERIYLSFKKPGKSVLIQGPGGTGKTYIIKKLKERLEKEHPHLTVCVTALTGIAAINVGGKTIHSWSGMDLARFEVEYYLHSEAYKNKFAVMSITDVLFVDEISMWSKSFFEKVECLARKIRKNERFFGGIKLFLIGDFCQLPPVQDDFIFYSDVFPKEDLDVFTLYEPKRYNDITHFDRLLRIRKGIVTDEDDEYFRKKLSEFSLDKIKEMQLKPTMLYSKKADVEFINKTELNNLQERLYIYNSIDNYPMGKTKEYENILNTLSLPKLELKVGAQVMHTVNNPSLGLVNGSRGVIVGLSPVSVEVKYVDGRTLTHAEHVFNHYVSKKNVISRRQYPFILAWATTIHKSQGCTLDYVICDLGQSVFLEGQGYVAISRVKTSDGLFICSYNRKSIKANKKAVEFTEYLESISKPIIENK